MLATVDGVSGRAMPRAGAICVTASTPGSTSGTNASNRLIATAFGTQTNAGPGGAQTTPSRVYFSNAGQPEIWETDGAGAPVRGRNYIDLTPGDGEKIMAAVAWRELVFIFKETKFFVLWGEGTNPTDGTPTFQVREVVNAIGLASPLAVAAGRDGVFFMNRRGVYQTSGGDPKLLSDVLSPMWTAGPRHLLPLQPDQPRAPGPRAARCGTWSACTWRSPPARRRPTTASSSTTPQHQWWSLYDLPASALASFRADVQPEVTFGYAAGPKRVGHLVRGADTDVNNAIIVSRWRSGWADYGTSQQMVLRETKVWGSGAVIVSLSVDFERGLRGNLDTVLGLSSKWPMNGDGTWDDWLALNGNKWPGAGQISDALVRYATRGTVFSTQFSNSPSSPSWSVHRVARHMRENREPSIR